MIRNNSTYSKQPIINIGQFLYRGTAALKRGYGMCLDLDYLTTATGETAADAFGKRGLREVAVPSASNANRFAGVLMQNYAANPSAKEQLVTLALPGGCAEIAQRVISTSGVTRVTCIVDRTAGQGLSGMFGHGGLNGRGSAIALQTLAAATLGNLALTNTGGTATGVYSAATGLTTITLTGAGTALGYVDAAVDASDYELTVLGGATAATGVTRCTPGIYPVYQATGENTFTVVGNTGDGAMTTFLTKVNHLMLAYLEDGPESGLSEYVVPITGAAQQFVLTQGGTTFIVGGITIAGDCTVNTLADPILIGGLGEGARKAFYALGKTTTSDYVVTVTSGIQSADHTTALQTIVIDEAKDEVILDWHGNIGVNDAGAWHDVHHVGCTYT
jgi:hypothetical protein